ncbi:MAG: hypothetical protein OEZ59_09690 [Deltaproteobacteria bacterium]|nr:hypothetical protein [Deltaproteobacteria bacterium]
MSFKKLLTVLICLAALSGTAQAQDAYPTIKFGLNFSSMSNTTYLHEHTSGNIKISEPMVGTELMFEYLVFEHVGFDIDYTISPYERNYALEVGGTNVATNAKESASYFAYGVNLYFDKAYRKGLTFWTGVSTGVLNVSHEFEGGELDGKNSSDSMNLQIYRLGFDWVTTLAGMRFRYQYQVGEATNTKGLVNLERQQMDYTGSTYSVGVYMFF